MGDDIRAADRHSRKAAPFAGGLVGNRAQQDTEAVSRTDVRGAGTGGTGGARRRVALMLVVLALALAGCGGQSAPVANAPSVGELTAAQDATAGGGASAASEGTADATRPADIAKGSAGAATGDASGQRAGGRGTSASGATGPKSGGTAAAPPAELPDKFEPSKMPPKDAVKATASVSPECVRPGGTVTITVRTLSGAGVGYHAFYADGKGGGPPPYGASYGGNNGALADDKGVYSDKWTVAANAPSGAGRVDVVVGHDGKFGNTSVPFAVADPLTGTCSQ